MFRATVKKWMLDLEQAINAPLQVDERRQVEQDRAWALERRESLLFGFPFNWR